MKDNIPFFSVIIPTYNRGYLIRKAIFSVLHQKFQSFELIVIDDGSTDNTEEIVKGIDDPRFIYKKIKNSERGAARNEGIKIARGNYITFLDSDDFYYRDYLSNADESLKKYNYPSLLHLRYEVRDETGKILFKIKEIENDNYSILIKGNYFSCMGVILKREVTDSLKFREDREIAGSEDWELWLRIVSNYGFKTDHRISACMIQHEQRSVMEDLEPKLVKRKEIALKYAFDDPNTRKLYGRNFKKISAFLDTYISLHLVLAYNNSSAFKHLLKAIKTYPYILFSRRTLAIVKHILLNTYSPKKINTYEKPYIPTPLEPKEVFIINPAYATEKLNLKENGIYSVDKKVYDLIDGYYKIASTQNYTSNFGFQWNKFSHTQIDKFNGQDFTYQRFYNVTGWDKEDLKNKNILEIGCGAGRFSQIILDYTKANLYSIDYSESVAANFRNNGINSRLKLFQASIYEMPFADNSFDKIFCFGVLQHTPDIEKSIQCMISKLKPGGELIIDFYEYSGPWTKLSAKYILRPFLKNLSQEKLLKAITQNIGWMIFMSKFLKSIRLNFLCRFIPICDIQSTLPVNLNKEELREWAILDTFDMFSPEFDNPQKIRTVKHLFKNNGMKQIWGGRMYYGENLRAAVVKGIK